MWRRALSLLPPRWSGYRCIRHESVREYFARRGAAPGRGEYETVHEEARAANPLPGNVTSRDDLPDDRGWWGYSFRDVPARVSGETFIATLPDCHVVWYRDATRAGDFYPAILNGEGRGLDLRELRFRPGHAEVLRGSPAPVKLKTATWILERVYHNHSHWLTAHLPKVLLLRERNALGDVLFPRERSAALEGSLRLLDVDPDRVRTFDPARPLRVERLTLLGTDRFRPELLRLVPEAYGVNTGPTPWRRVFISRSKAARRRLLNEDEIWRLLRPAGFERLHMEDLTFGDQVALMRETAVLVGTHGAGLTNMMFCPAGAHVVELADPGFPNPNFYALAAALGHRFWLVPAESFGDCHPLEKDLRADPEAVKPLVPHLTDLARPA